MLPEGWDIKPVGDLFEVQLGKMLNKKAKELQPQYPYIGNSNVRWGSFDLSELKTMHFNDREVEKFTIKSGDILLCEGGEVGRCAIWQDDDTTIYYQKALHRLRVKSGIIPEFFQSYMTKISGTKLLDDHTTRTSIAHLTREKLISLPVKLPSVPEQRIIAKILNTWDKAIATTEKLLENSNNLKKTLVREIMAGKKRFAGYSEDWKQESLSKIATITMGSSPKSSAYNSLGEGLPLLQGNADIKNRRSAPKTYTNEITKECSAGDILLSVRAPVGTVAKSNHHACIGRGIAAIKAKKHVSQEFIYQWLLHFEPRWERYSQGSTFEAINGADIKSLHILLPEFEEQQKITSTLSLMDSEQDKLVAKLALLKQEKTALMQQLLTGKLRVQV